MSRQVERMFEARLEKNSKPLTISERISALRNRFKLTKDALGEMAGVSGTSIANIESGQTKNPGVDLLGALSSRLPINPSWLLTGYGEMMAVDAHPNNSSPYNAAGREEVVAVGPLTDQPFVELPAPDMLTLAHFGQQPGLSMDSFRNSPTLRLYLGPDEVPQKYVGAIVITIFGDSMEPELHDGERMVVWFIPEAKWEQVHNTVCVIAYEETVTIKGIAENDLYEHNRLKLRAANPPSSYYVVGRNQIRSMWEVREYYDRPKYRPSFICR